MQRNDKDQNTLARLRLSPRQNRVHIPHQEQARRSGAQNHKPPPQQVKWQHTQHRHGDPDSKPVAVEGQHVEEVGLAAEVFGGAPDDGGNEEGIGVDCSECEGESGKVVFVGRSCGVGVDGFDDGGDHEEDEHYRRRNPERAIEVGAALHDIQKVFFGDNTCEASFHHLGGVDVEELCIVLD